MNIINVINNIPIAVDGDFVTQLSFNVSSDERSDPWFDVTVLKSNRFAVYKTHLDYLRAGAKIIKTNTYRATPDTIIKKYGMSGPESLHLITTAVELAQKAIFKYYEDTGGDTSNVGEYQRHRPVIAGACGSYGSAKAGLHERDDYWNFMTNEELAKWHRTRMQTLLNAGVDLLALEDIHCGKEAEVLISLLRQFHNARAWISFACPNDMEILDGNTFSEIALHCWRSLPGQIVAIGGLCPDLDTELSLLNHFHTHLRVGERVPIIAYFTDKDDCTITGNKSLIQYVGEWISRGVCYISGANNSTAEDTKTISEAVEECCKRSDSRSAIITTCSPRCENNKTKL